VYALALNRAEQGNYSGAIDSFRNRFFSSEEGGTNVRQVWVEVRLQQAVGLSRSGHCGEALAAAKTLGSPVASFSFTEDGLQTLLNSSRTNYMLGESFSACGQKEEAERKYRTSAEANDASDAVWAWASAKKLSGYNPDQWQKRLTLALSQAESHAQNNSNQSWWLYTAGVLQLALGRDLEGKTSLRESLLLPESQVSYHFSRLALGGFTPR
jgi:hypothetical protein